MIYSRYLSQTTYGNLNFVFSLVGILAIISLPGLNSVLGQSVAKGYEGTLKVAVKKKATWGIISSGIALIIAGYFFLQSDFEISTTLLLISLFFPIMTSSYLYDSFLIGKGLFKQSAIFESIYQVINFISIALTVIYSRNLLIIFFVYLFTNTLVRRLLLLTTYKLFVPNNKVDVKAITYGKHVSLISAVGALSSYIDSIIIFYFLGPVNLAIYSFATLPIDKIIGILGSVSTLALPKLSKATLGRINEVLLKRMFLLLVFAFLIIFVYDIFASGLYGILFPNYSSSVSLSKLYAICLLFKLPTLLLASFGQAKVTLFPKKFLYISNIIPQVIFIISLVIVGKYLGIQGIIQIRVFYSLIVLLVGIYNWRFLNRIYSQDTI